VKDIISDYEEHFRAGIESGRSEIEIAESLGDPATLGKQLKANYHIENAEKRVSFDSIFRAVLATAGLGLFNLIFIAFPFFGLLFLLFCFFAGGMGTFLMSIFGFASSVAALFIPNFANPFINMGIAPITLLFFSVSAAGFSILFLIGCCYLAKWFYRLTISYLRANINIIKGNKEIK